MPKSSRSADANAVGLPAFQRNPEMTAYTVGVVGFCETERIVLGSIFGLSARRNPRFVPFVPRPNAAPDLFLVDADDAHALSHLQAISAKTKAPILLVGASAHGTRHFLMQRPLRWAETLKMFEQAMRGNLQPYPPAGARRGDRVLVVDSSPAVRKFMETKLAPFGFNVDYAASGEQAIGYTGDKRYTCVFLDAILPGMDGYQVCKRIKARKGIGRKTAVVMLASKSSPFDNTLGTMAGCDAYLTKPLDEERLLEVMANFLPRHAPEAVSM